MVIRKMKIHFNLIKKFTAFFGPVVVTYVNCSYLGDRDQENHGLSPVGQKVRKVLSQQISWAW
jgi:hypothetical protein